MQLSISNIAWSEEEDTRVYAMLSQYGYDGVDIAPPRLFKSMTEVSDVDITQALKRIHMYGLRMGGMQSLLYNKPDLTIFHSDEMREATQKHLEYMIDLAVRLGSPAVVFGSPKNRIMGERTIQKERIAHDFFNALGSYAYARGVMFCLEPVPASYGTDFLTTTEETCVFVNDVHNAGLKINLDMGTMIANGEDPEKIVSTYRDSIGHAHISMPGLAPIEIHEVHMRALKALHTVGYSGWVSIEMQRIPAEAGDLDQLNTILQKTLECYRGVLEDCTEGHGL